MTLSIHSTHPTLSSIDDSKLLVASRSAIVAATQQPALALSKDLNCVSFSAEDLASLTLLPRESDFLRKMPARLDHC